MPDFGNKINDRQEEYNVGCTLIRADNKNFTISLKMEDEATKDNVDDWAAAIGACSNAGLVETRTAARWWLTDRSDVLVYDEAGKDAVFVFQSERNPRLVQYVRIPDFDASLYGSNEIDLTAGEVPLVISRTVALLNQADLGETSQSYVFRYAYLVRGNDKSHMTYAGGIGVDIEEPTALGAPGANPA